jgi:hypothetical protein
MSQWRIKRNLSCQGILDNCPGCLLIRYAERVVLEYRFSIDIYPLTGKKHIHILDL